MVTGSTCWIASRCVEVSTKPPVPGVDASRKLSGDTNSELPVVLITWPRVTPLARSLSGSTWTCIWRSRWPQMLTSATPGTPMRRGLIFQRASTERSVSERSFADRPTIITRLVEESGCSITGGVPTAGSANDWVSRSCTACRAFSASVPFLKTRSTRT